MTATETVWVALISGLTVAITNIAAAVVLWLQAKAAAEKAKETAEQAATVKEQAIKQYLDAEEASRIRDNRIMAEAAAARIKAEQAAKEAKITAEVVVSKIETVIKNGNKHD